MSKYGNKFVINTFALCRDVYNSLLQAEENGYPQWDDDPDEVTIDLMDKDVTYEGMFFSDVKEAVEHALNSHKILHRLNRPTIINIETADFI